MPALTVCQSAPVIVASQAISQAANAGDVSNSNFFTPSAAGLFRLTLYLHADGANFPSGSSIEIDWSEPNGSGSDGMSTTPGLGGQTVVATTILSSVSGSAISFASSGLSSFAHAYHGWLVLEQLA